MAQIINFQLFAVFVQEEQDTAQDTGHPSVGIIIQHTKHYTYIIFGSNLVKYRLLRRKS